MEQTKIRFFFFFLNLDWFGRTENCGTTVATMFYFQSLFLCFDQILFGSFRSVFFFYFLNKNHNFLYISGNVFFQPSSFQSFISLFGTSKSGFMVKIQCREYLFLVVAIFFWLLLCFFFATVSTVNDKWFAWFVTWLLVEWPTKGMA